MPSTKVVFYQEDDKSCPVLEWLQGMPLKARIKCMAETTLLAEFGHELRRPHADYLRDGIYELRARYLGVQYRILYFFHGNTAAVAAHGIVKESIVPPIEIERAIKRKAKFEANPAKHTYTKDGT